MNIKLELAGTKRLAAGHPWVRREDLSRFATPPEAGEIVRLQDGMGNFLGHAVSEGARAAIPYRILSRSRHPEFNEAYFAAVIEQALAKRGPRPRILGQSFMRLVHGEADGLPGVFCDRIGDTLLLDYQSHGMLAFAEFIEKALQAQVAHKTLWKRAFGPWKNIFGQAKSLKLISERAGIKSAVRLDEDATYDFDPEAAADIERLKSLGVKGESLLAFSRNGTWAAALAAAGSKKVLSLERDAGANKRAAESLGLNSFKADTFETDSGDAFSRIDKLKGKRRFQNLILDSPLTSKSAHGRYNAGRQIEELAERLMGLAEPGALVIFSLRSGVISQPTFNGALLQGAAVAGFKLETLALHKAPADFPPLEGFSEAQGRLWQAYKASSL